MIRAPRYLICSLAMLLGTVRADEAKPTLPEQGEAKAGIDAALDKLPAVGASEQLKYREYRETLISGKTIDDREFFALLRERHAKAEAVLVAPDATRATPAKMSALVDPRLIMAMGGAHLLALDASLRSDRAEFDRCTAALLKWNQCLLRPDACLLDWMLLNLAWRNAFNALLIDWERHPDQPARLAEIRALFEKSRIRPEQIAGIAKGELRIWMECGGAKGFLEGLPKESKPGIYLQAPFDTLTKEELLGLPYDHQQETARAMQEASEIDLWIRERLPTDSWKKKPSPRAGLTLDDYRKRSNGLGDLFEEQASNAMNRGEVYGRMLSWDPMMELCLRWLEEDKDRKTFTASRMAIPPSPYDGKPLPIDLEKRMIYRSSHPPENKEADPKVVSAGFRRDANGPLQVPRWRQPAGK